MDRAPAFDPAPADRYVVRDSGQAAPRHMRVLLMAAASALTRFTGPHCMGPNRQRRELRLHPSGPQASGGDSALLRRIAGHPTVRPKSRHRRFPA